MDDLNKYNDRAGDAIHLNTYYGVTQTWTSWVEIDGVVVLGPFVKTKYTVTRVGGYHEPDPNGAHTEIWVTVTGEYLLDGDSGGVAIDSTMYAILYNLTVNNYETYYAAGYFDAMVYGPGTIEYKLFAGCSGESIQLAINCGVPMITDNIEYGTLDMIWPPEVECVRMFCENQDNVDKDKIYYVFSYMNPQWYTADEYMTLIGPPKMQYGYVHKGILKETTEGYELPFLDEDGYYEEIANRVAGLPTIDNNGNSVDYYSSALVRVCKKKTTTVSDI